MDTLSSSTLKDKPHYTYVLQYPDNYSNPLKAGTVFYVGKGKGRRIHHHVEQARRGVKSYKCNVIRKILASGYQINKKILACFETHEEAIWYEIALIFFMDGLANHTYGGDGTMGRIVSEETRRKQSESAKRQAPQSEEARRKMSLSLKGRKLSEEHRLKIGKASKEQWQSETIRNRRIKGLKGHTPSEETRRKISEANKGKVRSEDMRHKMSEQTTKQMRSPEVRQKISEKLKGNTNTLGWKHSEETRRKLSESHKGHIPWNKGKRKRNMYQLEFPEMTESGNE